jgi:hypothetical protein
VDAEAQAGETHEAADKRTGYRAHDIDLTQRTPLHWVETPKGYWVVNLADRMLRVRPDGQGRYRLEVGKRYEKVFTLLADHLTQDYCFGIASDTARDAQILHMVKAGAQWRDKPPSPKQGALAQKLGIQVQADWTSGQVSDAIARVTGDWYDTVTTAAATVTSPVALVPAPWCAREGRCQRAVMLQGRCPVCKRPRKPTLTGRSN